MAELLDYLYQAVKDEASDVFIVVGSPVCKKLDNQIMPIWDGAEKILPDEAERLITDLYKKAGRSIEHYLQDGDDDFSLSIGRREDGAEGSRFRVNTYRQRGSLAAVIRVVPFGIPDWRERRIDERVMNLAKLESGMVLVTGRAGDGKSTTQACIIDRINRSRQAHIITLEDPIEYLHQSTAPGREQKSIVSQREVGIDTEDYLAALRACLRQAPDVILLGEMRDPETIQTAITAAETGHLLIATLHTKGAVNTIDRIVDSFPEGQQEQIRLQLSTVLKAVVSQQLLPAKNGGQIPAFEIMIVDPNAAQNISALIRENKVHQINNAIISGGDVGMISMDQYLLDLYKAGEITRETALEFSDNKETQERRLNMLR